jgi:hypothetical protein
MDEALAILTRTPATFDALLERVRAASTGAFTFGQARCDHVVACVLARIE